MGIRSGMRSMSMVMNSLSVPAQRLISVGALAFGLAFGLYLANHFTDGAVLIGLSLIDRHVIAPFHLWWIAGSGLAGLSLGWWLVTRQHHSPFRRRESKEKAALRKENAEYREENAQLRRLMQINDDTPAEGR